MADPVVLPLDIQGSLDTVGGKGRNLSRLLRAGFPVPPGFILTTRAYDDHVRANDLGPVILGEVRDLWAGAPAASEAKPAAAESKTAALEAASQTIRAWFSCRPMPVHVADALVEAYAGLGCPPVAVRSSATAEDLPGFSFAGQQDTFLNVIGEDALQQAVVSCWSSLWTARAIGYRARNGIDHAAVSLAVVVQEMVHSETSGVLFTANPLTGRRTETVIEATFGLGEALVSGQVEPDQYVVDAGGQILSKTLGAKSLAIRGQAGGGMVTVHSDAGPRHREPGTRQALSDAAIRELAQMGRRAADLFGAPQDIEWAGVGDRLLLLQSRPITTLYPLPEGMPAEPLRAMFSFGSVQGMLDPMTPLGRDAIVATLTGVGRVFGTHLTLDTQTVLWEAGERLWLDVAGLVRNSVGRRLALAALPYIDPGASQALKGLIDEGRFPSPGPLRARTMLRVLRVLIPMVGRALRTLLRPDAERERLFWRLEAMLADFEARFAQATGLPARLTLIRQTTERAFDFVIPQFVPRFGMGMATYNLLAHFAATVPDQTVDVQVMMRGVPHNVTIEMDLALWETARAILADPESLTHFRACEAATLADEYVHGRLPRAAQGAIGQFMRRYGMRGLGEIDLGRPRWREEPLPILQALRGYLEIADPERAPDAVYARGKRAAEDEIDRLATALRRTRGGWLKAGLARRAAYRMRALIGLREAPKFAVIRIFGVMRQALLVDGTRLAADGVLSRPDDVFFLRIRELEALAAGAERDWAALAQDRRQSAEREKRRRQVPRLLLSDGQAFYEGVTAPQAANDTILYGDPVSPGAVEGVVRVVRDPRTAQLVPGEILVCPGTDPSWTPLFLIAGGLVMELGGMMTHGAVVAREYGLPAVVGVHGATRRLRTGQRVRVDGSSGEVVLLKL
jgi:pyruvate,water dikinase